MDESYVVKKLLREIPAKFLQITSTMEQFGDLKIMTVEETIGSLKAHKERLKGKIESIEGQLMLTEEEWSKKENENGKLLLTREELLRCTNKGGKMVLQVQNIEADMERVELGVIISIFMVILLRNVDDQRS